jgi:hypothetical protein
VFLTTAGIKEGLVELLPTCKGRQDVTGTFGSMMLANSAFPRKLSESWARALRNVRQPFSGLKEFKNIGFKGRQIIKLLGIPNY